MQLLELPVLSTSSQTGTLAVEAAEICSLRQALVLDPATARARSLALQRNLQVVAPAFHWRGPVVIYGGGVGELVVLSKTAVRLDSFDSTSI